MFRKIVTELAYSPALAGSLSHYIKGFKNETSRRQIGLIFIALAVTVQILASAFPPESANASNPNIFIDGGIQSAEQYLNHFDQNTGNVRDLLVSLGVTRSDIKNMKLAPLPSTQDISLWSMQNNREETTKAYSFQTSNKKTALAYYQPLAADSSPVYVGSAAIDGGWFAITKDSANLITKTPTAPECATTPPKPLLTGSWSDASCLSSNGVTLSLSARAISPRSASSTPDQLHPLDRIAYTLSAKNNATAGTPLVLTANLEDILEYTRILDYGGGDYDYDTKNMTWPVTTVPSQGTVERTFIVQALPTIPSTAQGQHISASYDCTINTTFGDTLSIPVDCPFAKQVERITNSLPRVSAKINIVIATCLLATCLFFYARARQILAELYIIRHNHLGGL